MTPRTIHPDAAKFPQCSARNRIRKAVPDCFCTHPDHNGGRSMAIVTLSHCLACPFAGSNEPVPPQAPKVGDILADLIERDYKVTLRATCDCTAHIVEMNNWGPDGCEENIDTIVGWLVEGAKAAGDVRGLAPKWAAGIVLKPLIMEAVKTVRDWTPTVQLPSH